MRECNEANSPNEQKKSIVYRGSPEDREPESAGNELRESCLRTKAREYGDVFQFSNTQFFSTCEPLDFFCAFANHLGQQGIEYRISNDKLKLQYSTR